MEALQALVQSRDRVWIDTCVFSIPEAFTEMMYDCRQPVDFLPILPAAERLLKIFQDMARYSDTSGSIRLTKGVQSELEDFVEIIEHQAQYQMRRWKRIKPQAYKGSNSGSFTKVHRGDNAKSYRRLNRRRASLEIPALDQIADVDAAILRINDIAHEIGAIVKRYPVVSSDLVLSNTYLPSKASQNDAQLVLTMLEYLDQTPDATAAVVTRDGDVYRCLNIIGACSRGLQSATSRAAVYHIRSQGVDERTFNWDQAYATIRRHLGDPAQFVSVPPDPNLKRYTSLSLSEDWN